MPPGITKTCLKLYREFRANPEAFFLAEAAHRLTLLGKKRSQLVHLSGYPSR